MIALFRRLHIVFSLAASLLAFAALKAAIHLFPPQLDLSASVSVFVLLTGLGLLMMHLSAAGLAPASRLMVRGVTILFAFYVVAVPLTVPVLRDQFDRSSSMVVS